MRTIVAGLLILVAPVMLARRPTGKATVIEHIATCPFCRVDENSPMQCRDVLEISRAHLSGTTWDGRRWTSVRGEMRQGQGAY